MENDYKSIDEAVFELQDIKRGKKSISGALCAIVVGIAMVAACYLMPQGDAGANIASTLLLLGGVLAVGGIVVAAVRLGSKNGAPYYVPTGKPLKRCEVFYDEKSVPRVMECLRTGDLKALRDIPKGDNSAVILVCYWDKDGQIAVCQLQRYVPHYFAPIHRPAVFIAPSAGLIKSIL